MPETNLVAVRLLKRVGPYQPGQVTGFPARQIDAMLRAGVAELYVTEQPAKKTGTIRRKLAKIL